MLILQGQLRQHTKLELGKDPEPKKPFLKLWIEHETPGREGQPADIGIQEFLVPDVGQKLPSPGQPIGVSVRAYPKGRDIGFQAIEIVGVGAPNGVGHSEPKDTRKTA